MATLTLSTIRQMIRDALDEESTLRINNTEINSIINDGYKDVSAKALAYEVEKTITTALNEFIFAIPTTTQRAFNVSFLDHNSVGVLSVTPPTFGHVDAVHTSGAGTPVYYFRWGDYLAVHPLANSTAVANTTKAFCSCYPRAAMSNDTDTPSDLPVEFHECVFEFALAFAALKLRRWQDAGLAYNRYIGNLQRRRFEYIQKTADRRSTAAINDNVVLTMEKGSPNG